MEACCYSMAGVTLSCMGALFSHPHCPLYNATEKLLYSFSLHCLKPVLLCCGCNHCGRCAVIFALLLFSLPCVAVVAGAGSKVKHSQARRVQSVLYECGPWANCPDGAACCQAASQQVTFNGCDKNVYAFWLVMS